MRGERPDKEDLRLAIASICGRFLIGVVFGMVGWFFWIAWWVQFLRYANASYAEWPFSLQALVALVLGSGLINVLLPTIRMLARAALNRIPFLNRYEWF